MVRRLQPDLRGDGHGAPALAVQGPHRVIAACRRAARWAARACSAGGVGGGGTGTALVPSGSGTGCWRTVALTASSARPCVVNTWVRTSARFCNK